MIRIARFRSFGLLAFLVGSAMQWAHPKSAVAQMPDSLSKVGVTAKPSPTKVAPGGTAVVAVVMEHDRGWHSWTNPGNHPAGTAVFDGAISTEIMSATPA